MRLVAGQPGVGRTPTRTCGASVLRPFPASVRPGYLPQLARGASTVARAQQQLQEVEEEVDPRTGLVISKGSAQAPVAGFTVEAGGHKWAYRKNEVVAEKSDPSYPEVLLLHGIASSSYSYRNTLGLLGADGFTAYAPDWLGHGDSDKPGPGGFKYTAEEYTAALDAFVEKAGIKKPFALVVHGYVLGQFGLLYALAHPDKISRLMILNTPLTPGNKLRPELAAYKAPLPFMRPPANKPFSADLYNATGSAYYMEGRDADVYQRPYSEGTAATAAIAAIMDKLDFNKLIKQVDEGYQTWRKPSVLLFGSGDPFIDVGSTFEFLESKRTNMKVVTVTAKLGHMPQEDFAEAVHEAMLKWLTGESDEWKTGAALKMTKYGVMEAGPGSKKK